MLLQLRQVLAVRTADRDRLPNFSQSRFLGMISNLLVSTRLVVIWVPFLMASCSPTQRQKKTPVQRVEIVQTFPHDSNAFTQGLVIHEGTLFEGTGQKGNSTLRKVNLTDGKVELQVTLDPAYFGEGITVLNGKIFQLTWRENTCFVYDAQTMVYEKSHQYAFEGWGITNNGKELILSDGTSLLRFIDPDTFRVTRQIQVSEMGGKKIKQLNELEFVNGEIWSNIWYEDVIARISPENGRVVGWIDLSKVYPKQQRDKESVMNGIAYDQASKRLFITGKNWPKLFEIKVID